jgi:glycosyltransferase involved in cell wall biosynthesis
MKIVVAQDALHAEGGVETYMASVIPGLRARGHSVALLFVGRRGAPRFDLGDVDGPEVAVEPPDIDAAFAELRAWGPDVCFSNNMAPLDVERRALDEWPVVKFMHGYFGTCVSALKTHAFPFRTACSRTLGPACLALYVPRHCGSLTPAALTGGYRWARAQQQLLTRYAAVVVASDHMAEEYARHGVPRERLAMLPLFPSLTLRDSPAAAGDRVLFLGRMTDLKGGDLLIRAVAGAARQLGRSIPLVMAGDGPQRRAWERLASSERIDAVFPGWLDADQRLAALFSAAVLAVPSVWPEPFGLVGLEAAAMGVPAVAFDTGGIRQWLHHQVSGLLVPPSGGHAALAAALSEILQDRGLRDRLSRGALNTARQMSVDAHLSGLERVLQVAARPSASVRHDPVTHR